MADILDLFKYVLLNKDNKVLIKISPKFFLKGATDKSAFVPNMAWSQWGAKQLFNP